MSLQIAINDGSPASRISVRQDELWRRGGGEERIILAVISTAFLWRGAALVTRTIYAVVPFFSSSLFGFARHLNVNEWYRSPYRLISMPRITHPVSEQAAALLIRLIASGFACAHIYSTSCRLPQTFLLFLKNSLFALKCCRQFCLINCFFFLASSYVIYMFAYANG